MGSLEAGKYYQARCNPDGASDGINSCRDSKIASLLLP